MTSAQLRALLHYLAIAAFVAGAFAVAFVERFGIFGPQLLLFTGLAVWALSVVPVWPRRP